MPEWRKSLAAVKASKNDAHVPLVEKQTAAMVAFHAYWDLLMSLTAEAHNCPNTEEKDVISTLTANLETAKTDGSAHLVAIKASKQALNKVQEGIKA